MPLEVSDKFYQNFQRHFSFLLEQSYFDACLDNSSHQFNKILLGLSGGLDSVVLLHLVHEYLTQNNISLDKFRAIYIHHGLSQNADDWQVFCQKICSELTIEFIAEPIELADKTKNIEAQAREGRYKTFSQYLDDDDILLTAHHQDDQIESFMLNLMRGSGIDGLSAMPAIKTISQQVIHIRPLLEFSRPELENYAHLKSLTWIEDESNNDERFDRNFLRHSLIPMLESRWPSAKKSISQSISHIQNAKVFIDNQSSNIEEHLVSADKIYGELSCFGNVVDIFSLSKLDGYLIIPTIKTWLKKHSNLIKLNYKQSLEIFEFIEKYSNTSSNNLSLSIGNYLLVNYKNQIHLLPNKFNMLNRNNNVNSNGINPVLSVSEDNGAIAFESGLVCNWITSDHYQIGVNPKYLRQLTYQTRQGGERIQAKVNGEQSLKKLWQELSVPFWERSAIPLVVFNQNIIVAQGVFHAAFKHENMAMAFNAKASKDIFIEYGLVPKFSFNSDCN